MGETNNKKKKVITIVISIVIILILALAISYAYFSTQLSGTDQIVKVGELELVLDETSEGITLDNAIGISDSKGMSSTPSTFELRNNGSKAVDYTIYLDDNTISDTDTRIDDKYLKYNLNKNGSDSGATLLTKTGTNPNRVLDSGTIEGGGTNKYSLNLWITDEVDGNYSGQVFSGKLRVEVSQEKSVPNAPELDNNMIAITYKNNNWVKADTDNANNDWYNYDEQKWANAVTVTADTRSNYLNSPVGTTISIDDIETMWVWIPRYSYSIGSEDGTNYFGKQGNYLDTTPTRALPGEIDVKFVPTYRNDKGTAKYIVSEEIKSNSWYTPDAFTFGDEELSGIWVGKFETSSSNPSTSSGGGNTTELDAMVKPNVTSWRDINVSNAFNVSQKMTDTGNRYGFTSNVDTYMMKNDEWGTIAYLSQSKYGKLGNNEYSASNKEVYQNMSNKFITGCSCGHPSGVISDYGCQYTYDVDKSGTGASTTGTIYGIYDMSGGAWEYVMGYYYKGDDIFYNPFQLASKYYNVYESDNVDDACNGGECLSHALSETAEWYGDQLAMAFYGQPWILRGGFYGNIYGVGIFYIGSNGGQNNQSYSFRLVIAP